MEDISGNRILVNTLKRWGITLYVGVNGGGIIHVTKYLEPFTDLSQSGDGVPRMLTLSEYVAGFVPIGYYLASQKIAVCIVTTGAAIKLASSGMTDAKLSNIPAIYLMALNSTFTEAKGPLQDVSFYGMNIIPQLQAELDESCILLDDITQLGHQLHQVKQLLNDSHPVALPFYPDILSHDFNMDMPTEEIDEKSYDNDIKNFMDIFPEQANGKRIILYVCSEAARYPNIKLLTTQFAEKLNAATVWSVNGANAVSEKNLLGYGYIMFGGNDHAVNLWRSINEQDIVIILGFDMGEYALNLENIPAGIVWHFTHLTHAYGYINSDMKHRVTGKYYKLEGNIDILLSKILAQIKNENMTIKSKHLDKITDLNFRIKSRTVKSNCVDLISFYQQLNQLWRPASIGFEDVCLAYKDRQYIAQRSHPFIDFYSLQDGSAMGGAFGLGVGAKLANPELNTFIFSGDGCWRLFAGNLADVKHFDLRLFIFNNENYAIVQQALDIIMPAVNKKYYHSQLPNIDFVAAAEAHGWRGYKLSPDLSNLASIMEACYETQGQSILIEVPVDGEQKIGLNSRLDNLKIDTYL